MVPQVLIRGASATSSGKLVFTNNEQDATVNGQLSWSIEPRSFTAATGADIAGFSALVVKSDLSTSGTTEVLQFAVSDSATIADQTYTTYAATVRHGPQGWTAGGGGAAGLGGLRLRGGGGASCPGAAARASVPLPQLPG